MYYVLSALNVVAIFLLGLFIKNHLPSYMDEKGKNLATKEDIADITRKTEEVQNEFREGFEQFSTDLRFKNDFFYKQYSELYTKLYAIVCQSEYTRRFIKLQGNMDISFDDAPFIETTPKHRIKQKQDLFSGKILSHEEEITETDISRFNKKYLCELIIENGDLATQTLLKYAIAYRYAYYHYSGNPDVKNSDAAKTANEEEFLLIRKIVCSIVKDYNLYRKELKMEYSEEELRTGIPTIEI